MQKLVVLLLLCTSATAFLFGALGGAGGGGGGGGGACCPPCAPPPVAAPPPPPPPAAAGGCCCPTPVAAGCGRKKREAKNLISNDDLSKCNSEELRLLILQNIKDDIATSLKAIGEKLKEHHDYTVLCSDKTLAFIAEADDYCQVYAGDLHCAVFRINTKNTKSTHEEKDDETITKKVEKPAELTTTDEKKEEHNTETKTD